MIESVDIVIPTYGDWDKWNAIAQVAVDSARHQTVKPANIWRVHDTNLAAARNQAFDLCVAADWIIFCDADDTLSPTYIESMLAGKGDMRWPSTIGIYEDGKRDDYPVLLQPKGTALGHNWMVIGTMIRRSLFFMAGGFRDDLPILEDWDLWLRCFLHGGKAAPAQDALYEVHVHPGSRNAQGDTIHGGTYSHIQRMYQAAWLDKFHGNEDIFA